MFSPAILPAVCERVKRLMICPAPSLPALSAVYRWLEQNDLDAHGRSYLLRQNIPGLTKTFEAPGVNDLWIVDFSPGPFLAAAPQDGGHSLVRDH